MRFGPLSLLTRTNSRRSFNIAAWHSPHSLTWRWLLHLDFLRNPFRRPHFNRNSVGWGAGIGIAGFYRIGHNVGGHIGVHLLWCELHWQTQAPMWFRDMWSRAQAERDRLEDENWHLRRKLDDAMFAVTRAAEPTAGAHLN